MAEDKITRKANGSGRLTASELRGLLEGVPDAARLSVTQNDPNDYREAGRELWWFEATWAPSDVTPAPPCGVKHPTYSATVVCTLEAGHNPSALPGTPIHFDAGNTDLGHWGAE